MGEWMGGGTEGKPQVCLCGTDWVWDSVCLPGAELAVMKTPGVPAVCRLYSQSWSIKLTRPSWGGGGRGGEWRHVVTLTTEQCSVSYPHFHRLTHTQLSNTLKASIRSIDQRQASALYKLAVCAFVGHVIVWPFVSLGNLCIFTLG